MLHAPTCVNRYFAGFGNGACALKLMYVVGFVSFIMNERSQVCVRCVCQRPAAAVPMTAAAVAGVSVP